MPNAVVCQDVGLRYPLTRIPSFKEWLVRRVARRESQQYLWALRHVSLEIAEGATVGIIGSNGAGKSTLLRLIAGILDPTEGAVEIRGSVAPIIELGTGFDHELSGRENVFFNGALLGRSRSMMLRSLDSIIAFSGLEQLIDAPLRTYSTGMIARLAFAIATSVDAEVILLDEILSVGDAAFQRKCEERISSFYRSGATVLLVSHDLEAIIRLCREVYWIDHGRVRGNGPAETVVAAYRTSVGESMA